MCGINGHTKVKHKTLIDLMNAKNSYRGPDHTGVWVDEFLHLGHNLLTISGETETSKQPKVTRKGNILSYNGEIYDVEGYDTDWLAEMLDFHGVDYLRKVNGHFALAWYEVEKGLLHLVRDHYGSKPLFYHIDGKNDLYFSSTLDVFNYITEMELCNKRLSRIDKTSRFAMGELTPYKNINKLYPGEIITWDVKKKKLHSRSHLHDYQLEPNHNITFPEIKRSIENGLRAVCDTKQTIGVSLSGGLDSNTVLSQIKKLGIEDRYAVSTMYDVSGQRDIYSPYMNDIHKIFECAAYHETDHVPVVINDQVFRDNRIETLNALYHPVFDFKRTVPRFMAMKGAAEAGVKVICTGDSGDEIFTGYSGDHPDVQKGRLKNYTKENAQRIKEDLPWFPVHCFGDDVLNNQRLFFLLTRDSYHIVNDLCAGYFSMEYRAPFTHQQLVRDILSVPAELKTKQHSKVKTPGISKFLLRGLFEQELPDVVVNTDEKAGWCIPWEARHDPANRTSFFKMADVFNFKQRNNLEELRYI